MTQSVEPEIVGLLAKRAGMTGAAPDEIIDTHISHIILFGSRAFKMKRSVKLPYVDFSTPNLRLAACEKEVALNSRTAPELYLGVCRMARGADGRLSLDDEGELIDAAVEMQRFDQSALLDRMAVAGTLSPDLVSRTAHMIAGFHRRAAPVHHGGGSANLAGVLDINEAAFAQSTVFATDEIAALNAQFRTALARHSDILDRRERNGKVRRCHGDLHLRNICLFQGVPQLFDCIEFNDRIATIDVLYDLAFLLMDLWHRGDYTLANLVINRYLDESGDDEDGFAVAPFFMAVRAAVRAHVLATQAKASDADPAIAGEAQSYFALARQLLQDRPPQLIAIGGFSGSGKTTIAEALAAYVGAPPGARFIESDRIRKALHGVPAETRLPEQAYDPAVSRRVYAEMAQRSGSILAAGASVVCNAVFDRPEDREHIEQQARHSDVPFLGIWLDVDPEILRQRVSARSGGPSDATVDVLDKQLAKAHGAIAWRRLTASRATQDIVADIRGLMTWPAASR